MKWKEILLVIVSAGALLIPVRTQAQDATSDSDMLILESMTVTARGIEEKAQDIPVSMDTITAEDILDAHVETMEDLSRLVPSFNFSKGSQSRYSTYNIRGIGSLVPGGFEDGSVSAYIDGVPIPLSLMDGVYKDLERIEVLRGPQGTLYGKNAQAGAINITTLGPAETFEARLDTDVGNNGQHEVSAMAAAPVFKDRLAVRLSADASSRDGLVYNTALGRDTDDMDRVGARATIDGTWSDSFKTRLSISYENIDNGDNQMVPAGHYDTTDEPFLGTNNQRIWFGGMTNTIHLCEGVDLKFITGGSAIDGDEHYVQSATLHSQADYVENQFTQEIRLDGITRGITWSAGAFYNRFHQRQTMDALGVMDLTSSGDHNNNSQAVFGEVTFPVIDNLKLTTGLRLHRTHARTQETVEHRTYGFTHSYDDEETFLGWNGRVALTYQPSDTDTLFVSVGRAYKPGGFQTAHTTAIGGIQEATDGYAAATTLTYEIGYKGLFFERRLSLDATVFFSQTKDEQVVGYDPVTFSSQYTNIDVESFGMELGTQYRATREMTLGGSIAVTHAYATEDGDLGWNGLVEEGDLLPMTPLVSFNLFVDYRDELPFGPSGIEWVARADFAYKGKSWSELTNENRIDSSSILNLSLGVEGDRFRVVGYLDNALDDEVVDFAAFGRTRPGLPFQFGLRGSLYF